MKTYIINLKRAERRREHILGEATKIGLDHEFIDAVDGLSLSEQEISALCDLNAIRAAPNWLTKGALGAALSHREVYRRMIEDQADMALVLEDDVILRPDLPQLIESVKANILESEVALLHYSSFDELGLSTRNQIPIVGGCRLMYPLFLKGVVSAACYLITRKAAETLYNWLLPIRVTADCWYDFQKAGAIGTVRCVYPMPVKLIGAKSTIESVKQSGARVLVTDLIDKYQIPILHQIITKIRLRNIESRSRFRITDETSPLDMTA